MSKYCSYCGFELEEDIKYCSNCGNEVTKSVFSHNYNEDGTFSNKPKENISLKGTLLVLITMIIQIVLNIYILLVLSEEGVLFIIDTALIILAYFGFKSGKRNWAMFAIIYGIISMIFSLSLGNFFNVGILLLIAGIVGWTEK